MTAARGCILGLIALAVVGCSSRGPTAEVQAEATAREAFARAAMVDAGAARALNVGSRNDVLFEEGFSVVSYDPPNDYRNAAFRWMGQRGHIRLRGHTGHAMSLKLRGWLNADVLRTKGVVTLYLNGVRIYDTGAVEHGHWATQSVIPAELLQGRSWNDLVLTVSAVAFHWSDPPTLQVVVVGNVEWSEMP